MFKGPVPPIVPFSLGSLGFMTPFCILEYCVHAYFLLLLLSAFISNWMLNLTFLQTVKITKNALNQFWRVPLVSHYGIVWYVMLYEMQLKVNLKLKNQYLFWMRSPLIAEYHLSLQTWNVTVTALLSHACKGMDWSYLQHLAVLHILWQLEDQWSTHRYLVEEFLVLMPWLQNLTVFYLFIWQCFSQSMNSNIYNVELQFCHQFFIGHHLANSILLTYNFIQILFRLK